MFFREKTSKNSKTPVLQLVENERTASGSKQKIIASLGTKLSIPEENRSDVARIVKDRLTGQQSLLKDGPELIDFADKIVKKIQTDGKWNSARQQVRGFNKEVKENNVAEIFVDDVQHGYTPMPLRIRKLLQKFLASSITVAFQVWENSGTTTHFSRFISDLTRLMR